MLDNLLKGYYRIIFISFSVILISIIALLIFQFNDKIEKERAIIHQQFQENTEELNALINNLNGHLKSMSVILSNQLTNTEKPSENPLYKYLKNHSSKPYSLLESIPSHLSPKKMVNFKAHLTLENISPTEKAQINTLLNLAPSLRSIYEESTKISSSYFINRDFLMVYPWKPSDEISFNQQSQGTTSLRNAKLFASSTNKNKVIWLEPDDKNSKKENVISALTPIYYQSIYFGTFGLDIPVQSIDTLVTRLSTKPGTIYLTGEDGNFLTKNLKGYTQTDKELNQHKAILANLSEYPKDLFKKIDDNFLYYETIRGTQWKIVYVVSAWDFYLSAFSDIGIYIVVLLVVVIVIQVVTFLFTQFRFVVPARQLLQHIQYESSHKKRGRKNKVTHSKLPKGWSLWFHVITGIFEDNRSLLQDMEKTNATLEKKVNERTTELQKKQEEILVQNEELRQQQEEIEAQRDKIEQQKDSILAKNAVMKHHNEILLILAKSRSIQLGYWGRAMRDITEKTATEIGISRVGIWQYDHNKQRIQCMNLYTRDESSHTEGGALYQADYPIYFEELNSEHIIVGNEAFNHPAMSELKNAYLQPFNIQSRLDVPFFIEGKLGGVLTCENQGNIKDWSQEDLSFAKSVADIITISYKSMRRRIAEEKIKNQQKEILVRNLELKQKQEEIENQTSILQEKNEILDQKNQELQSALQKLKKTQSQLVHSEKMASLGVLTAGIAHEINNPINYIKSGALGLQKAIKLIMRVIHVYEEVNEENFQEKFKEIEALKNKFKFEELLTQTEKVTTNIEMGVQRTSELVKELRTFSRMDAAVFDKFQIHEGIESTLLLLTNQHKYNIKIKKDFGKIPLIECYPSKLNQVFMNILNNAMQAIHDEGVIKITTRTDKPIKNVLISIKDTGMGMSKELQNKIFEPFFTTKEVGEGTGLGLAISMSIIEDHSGQLLVNSKEGKGTEFIIRLPLQQTSVHQANEKVL